MPPTQRPSQMEEHKHHAAADPDGSGAITTAAAPSTAPPPPSPSSTTKPLLATFLSLDIGGDHLVLPFLSTKDRLRLSECSQGLINYRNNLSCVKLIAHPSSNPPDRAALHQLLMGQQQRGCGLAYLFIAHRSLLDVLGLAIHGCFKALRTLDLTGRLWYQSPMWEEEDAVYLAGVLAGGGLEGLEELRLQRMFIGGPSVEMILQALTGGACPRLRQLGLTRTDDFLPDEGGVGHALVEALESGHLRHLQELSFNNYWGHHGVGEKSSGVFRALQRGACPSLARLSLSAWRLSSTESQALAMALGSGSCARLEYLDLGDNWTAGEQGWGAIFEALQAGCSPMLKVLNLSNGALGPVSAAALAHALLSGNCPRLQSLDLPRAFTERLAPLAFLQAIQQAQGRQVPITHLNLYSTHLDAEHGRMLGEAIGQGSFSRLEELKLGSNSSLGDEGVVPIMAGLEGGGCPHLRELLLDSTGMGPQGGHALSRALASGQMSRLERLELGPTQNFREPVLGRIGDEALARIAVAVGSCRRLRILVLSDQNMGREAGLTLLQTLREGPWTYLEEVVLFGNPCLGDELVGVDLGQLLEEGGFPRLRMVRVEYTGLSREGASRLQETMAKGRCPALEFVCTDYDSEEEEEEEGPAGEGGHSEGGVAKDD